jgi:hypothetical protein
MAKCVEGKKIIFCFYTKVASSEDRVKNAPELGSQNIKISAQEAKVQQNNIQMALPQNNREL